jgi:DNA-binding NarL/FixJ family response regulator
MRQPFDLAIIDLDIPDVGEAEIGAAARRHTPEAKLVVMRSGPAAPQIEDTDAFLVKPFSRRALLGCVRRLLDFSDR